MAQADTATPPLDAAPSRICDGCGHTDTHPRQIVVRSLDGSIPDELYHYDCIPHVVRKSLVHDAGGQAGVDATADGLRGADVQAAVYAATIADQSGEDA